MLISGILPVPFHTVQLRGGVEVCAVYDYLKLLKEYIVGVLIVNVNQQSAK